MIFIAEVKTNSPFGYKSKNSWQNLFDIAKTYGDWISIHTDPRWGGSFDLISRARQQTRKPILAKGIHASDLDIDKALELGANYVLVVGRTVPESIAPFCLHEPNTLDSLIRTPHDYKAVWNIRDLNTGADKPWTYDLARQKFAGWLCQASRIRSPADVHPLADAILVGENLQAYIQSVTGAAKRP
ncbi:MAG TPA: hypothetical protein VK158_01035 [Acidobacteriota bacterium]|nr:hypothetical protein [Acidobacteriota bacterium]